VGAADLGQARRPASQGRGVSGRARRWALPMGAVAVVVARVATAQPADHTGRTIAGEALTDAGSGHDGAFVIADPASGARLELTGWSQVRYTVGRAGRTAPPADGFDSGFSLRRTRLTIQGVSADGRFEFKATSSFSRAGGGARLSDAFLTARLAPGAGLRAGQFKPPFAREELTSAKRLLATDRSITNDVFGQGRSQGVELMLTRGEIRAAIAFSDGFGGANTDLAVGAADWAVTGRVEWTPIGSAGAFRDFSSPRGAGPALLLAAAGHAQRAPSAPGFGAMTRFFWTADAGVEGDGWHAFAAVLGRSSDEPAGTFHDLGVVASASVFVTDAVESFVRFDAVLPDGDRPPGGVFRTLTVGGTWFVHGHSLKVTLDAQVFLDDLDDAPLVGPLSAQGLLAGARAGSFAVRAQVQFVF